MRPMPHMAAPISGEEEGAIPRARAPYSRSTAELPPPALRAERDRFVRPVDSNRHSRSGSRRGRADAAALRTHEALAVAWGKRRAAPQNDQSNYACSIAAMFVLSTAIVFASSSVGLNSTTSLPANRTGVWPGGA